MDEAEDQIFDGMQIYDWDGVRLGMVSRYDTKLGYFETIGPFTGPRYIPFSAVERVGPSGAFLNVPGDIVRDLYKHIPRVKPELDREGKLTGGARVASGYTGRPVPLDAEGVQRVREMVKIGSKVFDVDGKKVGVIQMYDANTGYMRIEKGHLFPQDLFLPVTAISFLDERGIHLSESNDNIMNHFGRVPDVAKEFFAHH